MLSRPRLRPDLGPVKVDAETAVLLGERARCRLRGGPVADLLPLLDGTRGPDEVVAALEGRAAPEEVYYSLLELERRGYVVEADGGPPERAALLAGLGVDTARLREPSVRVASVGAADAGPLRDGLAELGIPVGEEAALSVVVAEDCLQERSRTRIAPRSPPAPPGSWRSRSAPSSGSDRSSGQVRPGAGGASHTACVRIDPSRSSRSSSTRLRRCCLRRRRLRAARPDRDTRPPVPRDLGARASMAAAVPGLRRARCAPARARSPPPTLPTLASGRRRPAGARP